MTLVTSSVSWREISGFTSLITSWLWSFRNLFTVFAVEEIKYLGYLFICVIRKLSKLI